MFFFGVELAEIAERNARNRIDPLVQSSDSQPNMTAPETAITKDHRVQARKNLGLLMFFNHPYYEPRDREANQNRQRQYHEQWHIPTDSNNQHAGDDRQWHKKTCRKEHPNGSPSYSHGDSFRYLDLAYPIISPNRTLLQNGTEVSRTYTESPSLSQSRTVARALGAERTWRPVTASAHCATVGVGVPLVPLVGIGVAIKPREPPPTQAVDTRVITTSGTTTNLKFMA